MSINSSITNAAKETGGNLATITGFEREQLRLLELILAEVRAQTGAIMALNGPVQDEPERLRDIAPVN